ncbi:MAG: hypothetical protein ETSY1_37965, partial [Candidatus Entotheonella factor]
MANEIPHPHDAMVGAVLRDLAEARSFLQTHLPEEVSQALDWSTLRLAEGSFVDEDLRRSESDLLYAWCRDTFFGAWRGAKGLVPMRGFEHDTS